MTNTVIMKVYMCRHHSHIRYMYPKIFNNNFYHNSNVIEVVGTVNYLYMYVIQARDLNLTLEYNLMSCA